MLKSVISGGICKSLYSNVNHSQRLTDRVPDTRSSNTECFLPRPW